MTKQEQIEEMAKERNEIKDIMKLLDKCVSLNPMDKSEVASVLYGNNYRKLPEDSVVLSREEYEMLKSLYDTQKGAIMTSSIGDLPLTVEGLRKAVDEITRLNRVETELQELTAKYSNEAKDLRRELKQTRKETAEKKPIDFVGLRKRFLTISTCLMAAIVLCAVVFGVHLDTEFTGGAMITLSYEGSFTMSDVQKVASSALENNGLTLQTGENVATGDQTLKISMPGTETVTTEQVAKLLDSLNESCPDNNFEQLSLSNVSAAMGTKFLQKSLVAVVFALVLILLYIALRFKNIGGLTGGMMAVLALVNDLMVVFGTFVLLRTALDGNFIAAMLTILGYSINDTVVVYDRIRENRTLMGKKASFEELVNHSVNQSARRTLITTITTVMALGVMCIVAKLYGLDSIFTFAFPLMMGMISGVYTSLCVSTSAWVLWSERKPKTKA